MSEAKKPADRDEEFVAVDDSELDAGNEPKGEVGEAVKRAKGEKNNKDEA